MNTGSMFHLAFVFLFVTFTAIRAYYQKRAQQTRGAVVYKDGKLHNAWRLVIGIPFMLSLLIYMLRPAWFAWAAFSLPEWARWGGIVLGAASLPLILWVQEALGSNFSTTLHVRQEHELVTHGPYRWVRHPMYTVLFIWIAAILLVTENAYIGGVLLITFLVIVVTRLRNEEATMIEKFGEAYRKYMQRTGRFLPRFEDRQG